MSQSDSPEVAIVGGGIVGLILALGLLRRHVKVKVYEQSRSFREIGAGVAFTANAVKCMGLVEPQLVKALRNVATSNGDKENPEDWLRWVDGYHQHTSDPRDERLLFQLYAGHRGFEGCHRAHLLDEIFKLVPDGVIEFRKRLKTFVDDPIGKIRLEFADGSTAEADAVLGCDGIKSKIRELMFGRDNPVSHPTYTHKVAYRGLVPMENAEATLGNYKAHHQHMHMGPDAHVLHFAVADHKLMNVVAFVADTGEWTHATLSQPAIKSEATEPFKNFGPTVRAIMDLLPDDLDKWAIFDTGDHLVPQYGKGRACLAGDAAHAASPHHGAGAGIGVEDALALCHLFELVDKARKNRNVSKSEALLNAFSTFSSTRLERTQWFVDSCRRVCDVYEWKDPKTGMNPDKCLEEITWRSHKIWYFDIEGMLSRLDKEFSQAIEKGLASRVEFI